MNDIIEERAANRVSGWLALPVWLALFGAALWSAWPPLANLMLVLGLLYTVQGIALVHAVALKRRLSPAWLLLFYLLLLVPALSQLVMALGVADAWADFRNRVRPRLDQR